MADIFDTLLCEDDLSSEEREELREQFEEDPALVDAWAHWRAAHLHIRERLQEQLSDRRLLVLYVLEQEGNTEALTSAEQEALARARDDIARALEIIPALERVVERIREERADFNEVWETRMADVEGLGSEVWGRDERFAGRSDRSARPPQSQDGSSVRRWTRRLAGTAVVAILAVAATLFWMQGPDTTTITVADGAVRTVVLHDGSTVRLVGPATFTHPTAEAPIRHVSLDRGRAFFDVQHQDSTSFTVRTPTAVATVLGTQFGVTTAADTTEVVLASGSVRLNPADALSDRAVVLEPGQKSWVTKGDAPASPSPVNLTATLEWTGLFVFRSMPMDAIAQKLSQRYGVQVSIAPALADESITGTFEREQPVQQVLNALAATLGAEVQREGDEYRLVPTP